MIKIEKNAIFTENLKNSRYCESYLDFYWFRKVDL